MAYPKKEDKVKELQRRKVQFDPTLSNPELDALLAVPFDEESLKNDDGSSTTTEEDALQLVAVDEAVDNIKLIGRRKWKTPKGSVNKYQQNFELDHYWVFTYQGIPFWSFDQRFVQSFEDYELYQVKFKYSGTSTKGQKNIEVESFMTEAQFEKREARREKKDARAFNKDMRTIKLGSLKQGALSASDMDAIINA